MSVFFHRTLWFLNENQEEVGDQILRIKCVFLFKRNGNDRNTQTGMIQTHSLSCFPSPESPSFLCIKSSRELFYFRTTILFMRWFAKNIEQIHSSLYKICLIHMLDIYITQWMITVIFIVSSLDGEAHYPFSLNDSDCLCPDSHRSLNSTEILLKKNVS